MAPKCFHVFTKALILLLQIEVERVKGIEPSSQAWEARILPLNHTRLRCASARQARTDADNVYQTDRWLATGLRKRMGRFDDR